MKCTFGGYIAVASVCVCLFVCFVQTICQLNTCIGNVYTVTCAHTTHTKIAHWQIMEICQNMLTFFWHSDKDKNKCRLLRAQRLTSIELRLKMKTVRRKWLRQWDSVLELQIKNQSHLIESHFHPFTRDGAPHFTRHFSSTADTFYPHSVGTHDIFRTQNQSGWRFR